jgi:hypothetical protein
MTISSISRSYEKQFGTDVSVIVTPPISGVVLELIRSAIFLSGLTTRTGSQVGGKMLSVANGLLKIAVRRVPESALHASDSFLTPTPFRGGS